MKIIHVTIISLTAFGLGFALSEYLNQLTAKRSGLDSTSLFVETDIARHSNVINNTPAERSVDQQQANQNTFSWAKINQLIASANYDETLRMLKEYLASNSSSAQAWYFLAQVHKKQNQPIAALEAWFHYLRLETDKQKIDRALADIKTYLLQLKDTPSLFNEDYAWLIAQFEELAKYTVSDGELHLVLASLSLKLNDNYQAQYHALMAANDPAAQKRAEDILAKLNGEKITEEITIPLTRFGNQYVVDANIEGYSARLLLDTGASLSGLARSYTVKYPSMIKSTKPIKLNTASGSYDSFLFMVNAIKIGNLTFNQHILAQLPMENTQDFDGLLGVDILGRFDFVIDQDAAVLHLKARSK